MICFQKIVSLFWRTTRGLFFRKASALWFAFKKLYLCSDEQPIMDICKKVCVVICFQKIVSLFWRTTNSIRLICRFVLWFAFKKLYLCSDEQQLQFPLHQPFVVICFQKIVSLFWRTTNIKLSTCALWLWFAFKKLYLCSDEQLEIMSKLVAESCDLLSKNCIFVLTNNLISIVRLILQVVICFQKIVSLFWRTTYCDGIASGMRLWFAFKKLYLCSDEQPIVMGSQVACGCDLLSKNCIFVLTNNPISNPKYRANVVICFQKIVSLFWRTTDIGRSSDLFGLWFAFKKLYLCSDEQH